MKEWDDFMYECAATSPNFILWVISDGMSDLSGHLILNFYYNKYITDWHSQASLTQEFF